jgi:hypothetical protein
MHDISEETKDFVHVCESIHALLAYERLTHDDRDLIEFSCINLLTKLRPKFRTANA